MIPITDEERKEICNLLAGAIARHPKADNLLLTWRSALVKLEGVDKAVFVRSAATLG